MEETQAVFFSIMHSPYCAYTISTNFLHQTDTKGLREYPYPIAKLKYYADYD